MSEPGRIPHLNRRNFLKALAGSVAGGAAYLLAKETKDHLLDPITKLNKDWTKAQSHTVESFLQENKQQLTNVRLGCSFSPEQMDYLKVTKNPKKDVKFLKEQLGMKDVRLSFRFDKLLQSDGSISFKDYDDYIQEFINQGFSICWNIDVFKTSRFPEHHFKKSVPKEIIPPPNTEVQLNDPLAQWVLDFNDKLYTELDSKYHINTERIAKGDSIQGINEPFTCAGELKLRASAEFLTANVKALHKHFSEAHIVINSPGVPNADFETTTLKKVDDFIEQIIKNDPTLEGKLEAGVDYYALTPSSQRLPLADRPNDMNAVLQLISGSDVFQKRIQKGIRTQVTEIQCEPWNPQIRPGNFLEEFIFALIRSLQVCDTSNPTLLSVWGVEYQMKQFELNSSSTEHSSIRSLIKLINKH